MTVSLDVDVQCKRSKKVDKADRKSATKMQTQIQ